jgi:hypothetical protein
LLLQSGIAAWGLGATNDLEHRTLMNVVAEGYGGDSFAMLVGLKHLGSCGKIEAPYGPTSLRADTRGIALVLGLAKS